MIHMIRMIDMSHMNFTNKIEYVVTPMSFNQ